MSGTPERDDDAAFEAAWARIVEDLTTDRAPATDPGLAALFEPLRRAEPTGDAGDVGDESAEDSPGAGAAPTPAAMPGPESRTAPADPAAAVRGRGALDPEIDPWEDEGHFTPPPPPDLPEGTPLTRLAWVGTLGGPATLLLSALTGWDPPRVVLMGAGLAFLAGFSTLVWLLPDAREDGWDDGARL